MTGTSGPRTGRARVLIADDEPALDAVLSVTVSEAGRCPYPAPDGRSGPRTAHGCAPHAVVLDETPPAVVLDGMPPALDGLQELRRLRFENPKPPVRTLTAPDAVEHRLDAPEAGADDSVHVPGDLVTAEDTRAAHRAGGPVRLTARKYDLPAHPRQILSRARILDHHRWAPVIHTVRGFGYAIRAAEDGG
ncbi:response regulator transcription factor [Streptomyces sviceus]|uniref:response regulator transcription factor n=1 Tax=Streptomyces sviceus TaxID=285530 RepID=UPI00333129DE